MDIENLLCPVPSINEDRKQQGEIGDFNDQEWPLPNRDDYGFFIPEDLRSLYVYVQFEMMNIRP